MANYYCDHGAYGLTTNRLGLDAPSTWGAPQEGDGSSKDAAVASSIGSILFGAVPTSGSISVCGASVSTTNVLNAASVDAAADALATNINATTATVAASAALGTPQLRNLVYARGPAGGAPAGTCQIMMRIGSATLNYATNSNAAVAHTLTGSPTVTQFAGGSGGCWGWLLNTVALGVSGSISALTYGSWLYSPYVVAAALTPNDYVWLRTGGASKTLRISSAVSIALLSTLSTNIIVDSNKVWTSDGTGNSIDIGFTFTATYRVLLLEVAPYTNYEYSLEAVEYGGFKIRVNGMDGNTERGGIVNKVSGALSRKVRFRNVHFIDESNANIYHLSPAAEFVYTQTNYYLSYSSCLFQRSYLRAAIPFITYMHPYSYGGGVIDFIGCHFDYNLTGITDPGPLLNSGLRGNPSFASKTRFIGTKFTGYPQGFSIYSSSSGAAGLNVPIEITFENCSGLKLPSSYWGFPENVNSNDLKVFTYVDVNGGFRYESNRGVAEFVVGDSIPVLTATLFDQTTLWSMRVAWVATGLHSRANPYYLPKFTTYSRMSTGVRTITVEMLVPDSLTIQYKDIAVDIVYLDNTETLRMESVHELQASAAVWTDAPIGYSAKKLTLTTAQQVLGNSEINCRIMLASKPSSGTLEYIYVNPEMGLS